jgi:rubrerythrin
MMFSAKADEENLPQIAHLFRAVAASEGVHARRSFALLEGSVKDTQSNLEQAFQSESRVAQVEYSKMLREAEEDEHGAVAVLFSQAKDVEETHAKLYKKALDHLIAQRQTAYYLCTVCGFVADGKKPESCPVCGASASSFRAID